MKFKCWANVCQSSAKIDSFRRYKLRRFEFIKENFVYVDGVIDVWLSLSHTHPHISISLSRSIPLHTMTVRNEFSVCFLLLETATAADVAA